MVNLKQAVLIAFGFKNLAASKMFDSQIMKGLSCGYPGQLGGEANYTL